MKREAHAVILAGGRGTRFWPRSRTRTPKQLLNIVGKDTMIEQTVARIAPIFPASRAWVVTAAEQAEAVRRASPGDGGLVILASFDPDHRLLEAGHASLRRHRVAHGPPTAEDLIPRGRARTIGPPDASPGER